MIKETIYNNIGCPGIAVVGMACRFPGANNYRQFWKNLADGVCSVKEISPDRWDATAYYSPDIQLPNKTNTKWLGQVDKFDCFDHVFFSISPKEANHMDPQQRLLLEETWHCIEDSGISLKQLQEKKTAVFVGVSDYDYLQLASHTGISTDEYSVTGTFPSILSNRISQTFNLTGESLTLDTACSSCLYAIREAQRSLILRECDYAFVAGTHIDCHPFKFISFSKLGIFSPDGCCRTFDKDANGIVLGEGIGVILLQRLDDALKENHHIYGVIKGIGVNHSGSSSSLTAPRIDAQKDVILSAFRNSQINPETVTYIEVHGTGTALGDPIEIEALTHAFRNYTDKRQFCMISSVKPNIGHLGGAAGIASLIKVLLMITYRKIPPTLHFNAPNPVIDFDESPFKVVVKLTDWQSETKNLPLRAGISAFGFGGANAHVIIEEPPVKKKQYHMDHQKLPLIFLLSAKTEEDLRRTIAVWKDFIHTTEYFEKRIEDICYTLMTGREAFPYRFGCSIRRRKDIENYLANLPDSFIESHTQKLCLRIGRLHHQGFGQITPVCSQLLIFRTYLEQMENRLAQIDRDLVQRFRKSSWLEKDIAVFSFMADYSYVKMLFDMGIRPDSLTCTQKGMWTALAVAGMIAPEGAISVLAGYKKWNQISLSRPTVKFYDPVRNQMIMPYRIDETYIRLLVNRLQIEPAIFEFYIDKAKRLLNHQPFFRKAMQEWLRLFQNQDNIIDTWIVSHTHPLSKTSEKDRLILITAIISSLHKLGRKWGLKEPERISDKRFYEILSLISDNILPKESFIRLVREDQQDISDIVETMNHQIDKISPDKSYNYLKKCQHLTEITDISEWSQAMSVMTLSVPKHDRIKMLDIGACDAPTDHSEIIQIPDTSEKNFVDALTRLWVLGQDIRWEIMYPKSKFKKTSLPGYPFSGKRCWVEKFKPIEHVANESDRQKTRLKEKPAETPCHIKNQEQVKIKLKTPPDSWKKNLVSAESKIQQPEKPAVLSKQKRLSESAEDKLRSNIEEKIASLINSIMGSDVNPIQMEQDFLSHGIDSIMAVEIINQINEMFHISLTAATLLECENVRQLAALICKEYASAILSSEIGNKNTPNFENPEEPPKQLLTDKQTLQQYVESTVADCINKIMGHDVAPIKLTEDFLSHGVDSIMAVEIINCINDQLNIALNAATLLESENVQNLARYICAEYGEKIVR